MGSKLVKMMVMACASQGTSGIQIWKKRNPHCSGGRDAAIDCSDGADPSKKVSIATKEEARAPSSATGKDVWRYGVFVFVGACCFIISSTSIISASSDIDDISSYKTKVSASSDIGDISSYVLKKIDRFAKEDLIKNSRLGDKDALLGKLDDKLEDVKWFRCYSYCSACCFAICIVWSVASIVQSA